ncbi:MAG: hypothetical protein JO165_07120 [Candidatus Eremiobacteraeota bacterium]|nr:hypothetical protein [Candidatus Eremiobacteraeota bacterium]
MRVLLGLFVVSGVALSLTGHSSAFVTQRAQRSVYILVNVTPGPYGYVNPNDLFDTKKFGRGSALYTDVVSPDDAQVVAATQSAVRVEAHVTPDPTATLLYANSNAIEMNGTAGTTVTQTCAYTVTVQTAITSWQMKTGLASDFASNFTGGNLYFRFYENPGGTPPASYTQFTVYPTTGQNAWQPMTSAGGTHTYCIDLQLTIPITVHSGAYGTNAVYTLYW